MRAATIFTTFTATMAGLAATGTAFAQEALQDLESIGIPSQDGIGFQPAVTELMRDLVWFDNFLLVIITVICIFVTALLAWVAFRYNNTRNKEAATFTHNSALEVGWTLIPIVVLIAIVGPSLSLLFKQQEIPEADLTIKATGNQWYWSYEYVDDEFGFDSFMIGAEERRLTETVKADLVSAGYSEDEWLLATDTAVVVPINKTIVVQVTAADVIHSWAIPAFGVKQDGVPGRLAELWFNADKEGVYFGQCSELCGKDHTYMPITVKVVSQEKYDTWLEGAKAEFAGKPTAMQVASN